MRRLRPWLIGGGATTLLAIAAVGAVLSSWNVNAYRSSAEAWLADAVGVPVAISGNMNLSLGWTSEVIVSAVSLGRLSDGKPSLARIDRVELKIALLPFVASLGGELVAERVALHGVELWLSPPAPTDTGRAPIIAAPVPFRRLPQMSVSLRALEMTRSVLHGASGGGSLDIDIASAQAIADGAALRFVATGSVVGRSLRVEGETAAIDQWLARPPRPIAVGLVARLDDSAQLRVDGTVLDGGIDLALRAEISEFGAVATISSARPLILSSRMQARAVSDEWRFSDVSIRSGSLALVGEGTLQPRSIPDVRFKLQTALLDFARTNGDADAATPGGADQDVALRTKAMAALGMLDRFTAELVFGADVLALPHGIRLTGLHGVLSVRDGKAELTESGAVLAGGAVTATGDLAGTGDFTARLNAHNFNLGQVIRDLRGRSALTGGATVLRAEFRGRLVAASDVMRVLKGSADLSVGHARVSNAYADRFGFLQIFNLLDRALPLSSNITVNCAAGRFTVEDGVARTRGLMIDSPRLALWVSGRIDLKSGGLNLHVEPQPKVASLISVVPPANIHGTISQPVIEPDVIGAAVGVASGVLEAPGRLASEIGDVLGSLGALVTGSPAHAPRAAGGCQVPGRAPRDAKPGLHFPNPLDLFR